VLKFALGPSRSPARFLDAVCLGYVIWWIPRTVDRKLMTLRLFNFFNLLGRHSLQVFVGSLCITAVLSKINNHWAGLPESARLGLALGAVIAMAIPAWWHEMYRKHRRKEQVSGLEHPAALQQVPTLS
jgi:hypothetical protein